MNDCAKIQGLASNNALIGGKCPRPNAFPRSVLYPEQKSISNLRFELFFEVYGQLDGWPKNGRSWEKFESH